MSESKQAPAPRLGSLGTGVHAAVIGASGGIGAALAGALESSPAVATLTRLSRSGSDASIRLDLEDEGSIEAAAGAVSERVGSLHLVIVASGVLHDGDALRPEKTWRHISPGAMEKAFRVNATGPALVAKHFLPLLAGEGKSVFAAISARVGSIEDNRLGGWYAYRASKAALNMLIRSLAIELARRNPAAICVGLHPGTVDTRLSAPFQRNVPDDQIVPPEQSARNLLEVIDGLGSEDSGNLFAWDGERIPF